MASDRYPQVMFLPGGVLPAQAAYGDLLEAMGDDVEAVAKELEVYAGGDPPAEYSLDHEVEGILSTAEESGFERFHLVGYSAGGAASLFFASKYPERLLSLALLEAAWAGNKGLDPVEQSVWEEFDRVQAMADEEMMASFVRQQLAPGVNPPSPPPGPPPPWMATRPSGLRAIIGAFQRAELEPADIARIPAPTYFALGGLSNPDYYGREAKRLAECFQDFELEVFEDRHHFDPPHRAEPTRLAGSLRSFWDRATRVPGSKDSSP